jgi:hypothetical protein
MAGGIRHCHWASRGIARGYHWVGVSRGMVWAMLSQAGLEERHHSIDDRRWRKVTAPRSWRRVGRWTGVHRLMNGPKLDARLSAPGDHWRRNIAAFLDPDPYRRRSLRTGSASQKLRQPCPEQCSHPVLADVSVVVAATQRE